MDAIIQFMKGTSAPYNFPSDIFSDFFIMIVLLINISFIDYYSMWQILWVKFFYKRIVSFAFFQRKSCYLLICTYTSFVCVFFL